MTLKKVPARFYLTPTGGNPVRDWPIGLPPEDRREIGHDIGTLEYGWPLGMPLCRRRGLYQPSEDCRKAVRLAAPKGRKMGTPPRPGEANPCAARGPRP